MLPHEDRERKRLWPEIRDAVNEAERLHDVVVATFFHGNRWHLRNTRGLNELAVFTVMGLLTKACKTYRSVEVVCVNGLGDDAMTLARSLYETSSAALFILQKRSRVRAAMYQAYAAHQSVKMLEGWKKTPGLKRRATPASLAAAMTVRDDYMKLVPAGIHIRQHWSGFASLEVAAEKLHWPVSYQLAYRWMSTFAHGTDFASHVIVQDSGPLMFRISPDDQNVASALGLGRLCLWLMAVRIDHRLSLGHSERLRSVRPRELDSWRRRKRRRTA